MEQRQRRSRFSTAPLLNAKGQPRVAFETPWMRRVLTVMARYPFLTREWIAVLSGADLDSLIDQFKLYKSEPNLLIKIADFQTQRPELYMRAPLVYQPGPRADALLRKYDIEIQHDEWSGLAEHRLMSCQTRASFDLGLRDGVTIIPWTEIIKVHPTTPYIPTGEYTNHQKPKAVTMHADCNPFILQVGEQRHYFPGFELDRDTEPLHVIAGKCWDADQILGNKTYIDHLEFPDLTFLFVTVNKARMKNMQGEWLKTVRPAHRRKALFKVFKDEPTGWALTEPWQYADGTPFHFIPAAGGDQ